MLLIVMVTTVALVVALGVEIDGDIPSLYLVLNLLFGFFAAIVGGWVCARVARPQSPGPVKYLAGVVILFGLASVLMAGDAQPMWHGVTIMTLGAVGVWLGGRIHGSGATVG
jgi:hypothetical protein